MSFRSVGKNLSEYTVGWDVVVGVATPYGLDSPGDRIPVGGISCSSLDRACGPTNLLYNGYWVCFRKEYRPGRGVGHPPQSVAEFRERVELYTHPLDHF